MGASVKVMRSYDYCHFEICIGADDAKSDAEIDELRKRAARLADKAVEQYKIAKNVEGSKLSRSGEYERLKREVQDIERLPDGDRTPNQVAKVKLLADRNWQEYISERYDYQDGWDEHDE
jgi:uncharacterized protein YicC (UPF0701 family)